MTKRVKNLSLCAILSACALALSYIERLLPLGMFVPLPGIKLGLANLVTMFALFYLGAAPACAILAVRCVLGSLFGGGVTTLVFSLFGGFSALGVMTLVKKRLGHGLSLFGVSIAGAAAHNIGQIFAAMLLLGNTAPLSYLPLLLLAAILTGGAMAAVSIPVFNALRATQHTDI